MVHLEVHLAVEDDWAGGGGVLQHGNDLVEVLLGGSLRQFFKMETLYSFGKK